MRNVISQLKSALASVAKDGKNTHPSVKTRETTAASQGQAWNDSDLEAFGVGRGGEGILIRVGSAPFEGRYEPTPMQVAVNDFSHTVINRIKETFSRPSQTAVAFNAESGLINSHFSLAIGAIYPLPAGKSAEECFDYCINAVRETCATIAAAGVRLAIGAAYGDILGVRVKLDGQAPYINLTGDAFGQADTLMSFTEDKKWMDHGHHLMITPDLYERFSAKSQSKYVKLDEGSQPMMLGDRPVFVKTLPLSGLATIA